MFICEVNLAQAPSAERAVALATEGVLPLN